MNEEPRIHELAAQPAAVEHAVTNAAGIPAVVDYGFPALFNRLGELGITPAGPPFIRYLETGERFELELGVPVPAAAEGLNVTSLPAGRAAVLRHVGPFQGLPDSFERLKAWVEARGEQIAGPHWEAYVTDPRTEPDSSRWVTEVTLPLR